MSTFISMDEGVEVNASANLPDGMYEFVYQGVTNGQHEATEYDPNVYPTAIVDLKVGLPNGNTEQRKETFKLLDTAYNQQRIASMFRALGEPVKPNGKVTSRWQSFIGRRGWMKLETKKMNNGGDWQSLSFIFPEKVEEEKQKYGIQSAPAPQAQPQPQATWQAPAQQTSWNSGNGGTQW